MAGILEFCRLIHHPLERRPVSILGVCNTVLRINEKLGPTNDLPGPDDRLLAAAKFLAENAKTLEKINERYGPRRDLAATTALHGVLTHSPIYSLMYFVFDAKPKAFMRLQQVLFAALTELQDPYADIKVSDLNSYSLGIRRITETKVGQQWLESLDHHDLNSLEEIYKAIVASAAHEDSQEGAELEEESEQAKAETGPPHPNESETEETLEVSLKRTLKLIKTLTGRYVIRRTGRGRLSPRRLSRISQGIHGVSGIGELSGYELLVFGDKDDETEPPHIASLFELPNNADLIELEQLGVEHAEIRAPFEFIYADYQEQPAYAQAFNAKLKATGAIKAIERQNQYLPLSTQLLTSSDLNDLKSIIFSVGKQDKLLALLLLIMLFTSSDVERARTIEIFDAPPDFVIPEEALGFDLRSSSWILRGYGPEFATELNLRAETKSRSSVPQNHFLPEPNAEIAKHLRKLFDQGKTMPFKGRKQLPRKIRTLLQENGDRITSTRLSRYLLLKAAGKIEPTTASYIFSQYLPASSARTFYLTPRDSWLAGLYLELRVELLAELGVAAHQPTERLQSISETTFGGRYCPKTGELKKAYAELTKRTLEIKKQFEEGESPSTEWHNIYTAHCVITQGLLTGIRSVRGPFISIDQIDPATGITVFRDKDGEDQFHTRIAPVHPLATRVATFYRNHRTNQLARYLLQSPQHACELLERNENVPEVFLLNSKGKWLQVGPSSLSNMIGQIWAWPLNSNRKFLRTRLIEKGLEPYLIDVLLGHHSRGEAFWDSHSTSTFTESSEAIIESLDIIIEELGLVALEGAM